MGNEALVSRDGLRKYIGVIYEQEKSVYQQKELIQNMEQEIKRCERPEQEKIISKPNPPYMPDLPQYPTKYLVDGILGILMVVLFFFLAFIAALFEWFTIVYILFLVLNVLALLFAIGEFQDYSSRIKTYDETLQVRNNAQEKYNNALKSYYDAVSKEKERVKRENQRRATIMPILKSTLSGLRDQLGKSETLLGSLYAPNIIYGKYRSLIPVSSFYDYLESGRCDQLTGPDGAYNLYEMEARMDRIITQMDVIIRKLDQIREMQYKLYGAIQESNAINREILNAAKRMENRMDTMGYQLGGIAAGVDNIGYNVNRIRSSVNDIEFNTTMSQYYNRITAKETEYRNYMDRIWGRWH